MINLDKQYIDIKLQEDENLKNRKFLTVIIYDITDNKRRLKMSKFLECFGFRVQKSAFEAVITSTKIKKLREGIDDIIEEDDCVKIYVLKGVSEVYTWGEAKEENDDCIII